MNSNEQLSKQDLKSMAQKAAEILDEKKAERIVLMDVSQKTPMADFFLVASAESSLQLKVLNREIDSYMSEQGIKRVNPKNPFGETTWILSDYGFLVVHLFLKEAREYYNIEKFWHDAETVYKSGN